MKEVGLTPGPNSPLADAVDKSPMPMPPALDDDGTDLKMLTPEDIRARLVARERDMKFRIEALKREVMTVGEDLTFEGRPLFDVVRGAPCRRPPSSAGPVCSSASCSGCGRATASASSPTLARSLCGHASRR